MVGEAFIMVGAVVAAVASAAATRPAGRVFLDQSAISFTLLKKQYRQSPPQDNPPHVLVHPKDGEAE